MNFLEAQSLLIKILKDVIRFFPFKMDYQAVSSSRKAFIICLSCQLSWLLIYMVGSLYYMKKVGTYLNDENPITFLALLLESFTTYLSMIVFLYTSVFSKNEQMILIGLLLKIEKNVSQLRFS